MQIGNDDDTILIGLCQRFLALDGMLRLYERHRLRRDDESFCLTRAEWQRTLGTITPIPTKTDAGRIAKIHAARVALRHGKDAAALLETALDEFAQAHPFAAEPLRPADLEAMERAKSAIEAVGTITIDIPRRLALSEHGYAEVAVKIRLATDDHPYAPLALTVGGYDEPRPLCPEVCMFVRRLQGLLAMQDLRFDTLNLDADSRAWMLACRQATDWVLDPAVNRHVVVMRTDEHHAAP